MNTLAKMFEPSKDRLISNAKKMMEKAQDPWFKQYWQKYMCIYLNNIRN